MYKAPIRGKSIRKKEPIISPIGGEFEIAVKLVTELNNIKEDIQETVDSKVDEMDELMTKMKLAISNIKELAKGDPGADADNEIIAKKVLAMIRVPKNEKVDLSGIKSEILREITAILPSFIPEIDEESLAKKFLSKVPKRKPDLKIIQEKVEVDPLSVIDKIMALPEEQRNRLKLSRENISGLSQTINAFQSQMGHRGYLHGAGLSEVSHDGTLTGKGTTQDPLIVVGSTSPNPIFIIANNEIPVGSVDGVNTTFILEHAPSPAESLQLYLNGALQQLGVDYTLSGTTMTMASAPLLNSVLVAFYRYTSSQFVDNETPVGLINGLNVTFTLANTPSPVLSLQLFLNGSLQQGGGVDYTLVGDTITFVGAPLTGSILLAYYQATAVSTIPSFVFDETPTGAIDGVNTTYALFTIPSADSTVRLYLNGQLQEQGVDYTISGINITFATAPLSGSILLAYYQY